MKTKLIYDGVLSVSIDGVWLNFTKTEMTFLSALASRHGYITEGDLLTCMYSDKLKEPELSIIKVYQHKVVKRFKKHLGDRSPKIIVRVNGVGLMFNREHYEWEYTPQLRPLEVPMTDDAYTKFMDVVLMSGMSFDEAIQHVLQSGLKSLKDKIRY